MFQEAGYSVAKVGIAFQETRKFNRGLAGADDEDVAGNVAGATLYGIPIQESPTCKQEDIKYSSVHKRHSE
jgi:hypothetical protein